jgi:hypothetical protein
VKISEKFAEKQSVFGHKMKIPGSCVACNRSSIGYFSLDFEAESAVMD